MLRQSLLRSSSPLRPLLTQNRAFRPSTPTLPTASPRQGLQPIPQNYHPIISTPICLLNYHTPLQRAFERRVKEGRSRETRKRAGITWRVYSAQKKPSRGGSSTTRARSARSDACHSSDVFVLLHGRFYALVASIGGREGSGTREE
jgi:hypothetical protein